MHLKAMSASRLFRASESQGNCAPEIHALSHWPRVQQANRLHIADALQSARSKCCGLTEDCLKPWCPAGAQHFLEVSRASERNCCCVDTCASSPVSSTDRSERLSGCKACGPKGPALDQSLRRHTVWHSLNWGGRHVARSHTTVQP